MVFHKDLSSILLLFLIYVNDLPNVSKVMQFCLFADATSIYFDSDNLVYLQKIVNRKLKKIKKMAGSKSTCTKH